MTTSETVATKNQVIVQRTYQAFFTPSRYEAKSADREILERGTQYRLPYKDGELAVTKWGQSGPAVLLMHGWGGARAQMTGFVTPLLDAGYRVVAYDQPAHGESDGEMTNLLEIAPSMGSIEKREGKFDVILAHSFGTLITSYALTKLRFPPPTQLVYLGAMNRLLDSLPRFQVLAGLPDEVITGLRELMYEKFERGVLEAIVNQDMVQDLHIPTLMFHDRVDNVTPIDDSRAITQTWKSARLIETEGLGHRGALQSGKVHADVLKFLRNSAEENIV